MDGLPRRIPQTWPHLAGLLACILTGAGGIARAQAADKPDAAPAARADAAAVAKADAAARAQARAPRREASEAFKESIRKTVEKRRQRRARRAQAGNPEDPMPVGAIVPWPMPPALIVRQTPQVHDEVGSLLDVLRRAR